jgi:integrase/recombinase XerD
VADVINPFLVYLELERGRSANTISAYKKDLEQFVAIWEQSTIPLNPDSFSIKPVEQYLNWLQSQNYQPSTIARKCAAVRGFLEYFKQDDDLSLTYIDNYLRNLTPTRHRPQILSKEKIRDLLDAPKESSTPLALRDAAILPLMYETGIRAADVIPLLVEDFDPQGARILIRSIRLSFYSLGEASALIDRYLQEGRPHLARIPEENHLFLNQRGKALTRQGIWFIVKHWAKEADLSEEISPNTIRHSLIQHLLDSGLSNRQILRKLGLKSPNSLRAFHLPRRKLGDE